MKENAPSATAGIVARNLAIVSAAGETAHLVSAEAARLNRLFVEAFAPNGAAFLKRAASKRFQTLFRFYERLTIPGLSLHHALRKLFIERAVRQSLTEDFAQVVVLGGGFDTLALRLCREFPRVNFIELDHPATQRVKREAIERHNLESENLTLTARNLTAQNLAESLAACSNYRREAKTVFVCEGVLMYLATSEIDEIFDFIKKQNSNLKRFVFTFMRKDERGNADFLGSTVFARIWLRFKKEPFKSSLRREDLNDFLKTRGFRLTESATAETLRELYLQTLDLKHLAAASGEDVCICESE